MTEPEAWDCGQCHELARWDYDQEAPFCQNPECPYYKQLVPNLL